MEKKLNFIGKNIRFFRRSKNWTILQLASKIGIREGPLGRIERGLNLPSASVIYKLTNVLDISADALFASEISHVQASLSNDESFFVTIDPNPAAPPKNLLKACHDIMAAFHALEDICKVQKHAYLPLSIPFEPDYKGMDKLAVRVRNYLGTGDAVVFDYFELFENFGLRIILFPFARDSIDIASVSFYEPAFHNAFFFLNSRNNPEKQLFSLGLELGKILIFNEMRVRKDSLFPVPSTLISSSTDPASSASTVSSASTASTVSSALSESSALLSSATSIVSPVSTFSAPSSAPTPSLKNQTEDRPINEKRAPKRFAATFLMPEKAVRTTVSQLGIAPDNWSWDLLIRIKHRFGVSTEAFLYRLKELDLISEELLKKFQSKIKDFYNITNFSEPDQSRRCLTPNGRFFDLLLNAGNIKSAEKEVAEIQQLQERLKILRR